MPSTNEEVLGIFLKDPTLFKEYKRQLTASMFTNLEWVYNSMLTLDQQDGFTFKSLVMANYINKEYLVKLRNSVPATGRLPHLINELKKEKLTSEIYMLAKTTAERIGNDPNELLNDLQSAVSKLSNTESVEMHDTAKDVDDFFDWMEEIIEDPSKAFGLITGIEELDRITTGFHRGDFIVVGARTSVGKSAFMIEIVLKLALNGYKVAVYSLEMSKKQLYLRMLANLMTVDLNVLKLGRLPAIDIPRMKKHKEFLRSIYVDDTRGVSADYITNSMRDIKRTRGLDIAMVDYIQEVKETGESNDNGGSALGRVCRKLRKGAQDMNVPVFGLSQVNRGVEERKEKQPMPSDLTGSAHIEASADVIALLYRDDYYNADSDKKGIMEINFAKQRNASTGKIELYYDRRFQQVRSLKYGKMI